MQDAHPAFALETAACLWEAVLALRDHPVSTPEDIDLALRIRSSFEAIGTSALRLAVIGWVDAVDAAWAKIADDYMSSFDWDFVPAWIIAHVDWSDPGHPVLRASADSGRNDRHAYGEEGRVVRAKIGSRQTRRLTCRFPPRSA